MIRKISDEGLRLIKQWEGLRLTAYRDVGGVLTIGYGSTGPHVKEGQKITESFAETLLRSDLERFEIAVGQAVRVRLSDNQFAALVSFAFNVGTEAFRKSTLLKKLNAGQYDAVPAELMKWVNVKGKRVQGLVNRRSAEAGLWAKGSFVTSSNVDVAPAAPAVLTKENVAWGAGIASTLGASISGSGPIQWALAAVLVIAFGFGLYLFVSKRMSPA